MKENKVMDMRKMVMLALAVGLCALARGGEPLAVEEFRMDKWSGFEPLGNYTVETDGVYRVHHLSNLQGRAGGALNGKDVVYCNAGSEVMATFEAKGSGMANLIFGWADAKRRSIGGRDMQKFELTPEWKSYTFKLRVISDGSTPTEAAFFRIRAFKGAEMWFRNAKLQVDVANREDFEGDCANLTARPDAIISQLISPGLLRYTATAQYSGGRRVIAFKDNIFRMPQLDKKSTFDSTVRIYPVAEGKRRDHVLNMHFHGCAGNFRLEMKQRANRGKITCSLIESHGKYDEVLKQAEFKIDALPADVRVSAGYDGRVIFHAHTLADEANIEVEAKSRFFTDNAGGFATELEFLPGSDDAEVVIDEYAVGAGLSSEMLRPVPFVVENLQEFDPVKAGWKLVMQDDFEGDKINEKIWEIHAHGTGYWEDYWPELAFVSNGLLHIRADWNKEHTKLSTASIRTWDKYLYGYFEARLKFTKESGWWAAFWLYRKNRVTNPFLDGIEYDIFEDYFTRSAKPNGEHKKILDHNVHAGGCGEKSGKNWKFSSTLPGSLDDYYILGCRWTPFEVSYYLNGKLIGSFNAIDNVVALSPLQPIFSGQIMNKGWQNADPTGFAIPEDFLVDWIRVYEFPQPDKPTVKISCDVKAKEVDFGQKLKFRVDVEKAADGAAIKTVYIFDSGYLLDFKLTAPCEFEVRMDDQYYEATRWARVGRVGTRKPELMKSKHHAFAVFVLDEKGRYSASEVMPIDLKNAEE